MASDPPPDAPRTSDPMAPQAPARSIGTNHRRKPQPHHRPSSTTPLLDGLHELIRDLIREEVRSALAEVRPAADEYLTTAEAADFARVAPGTIRRWIREGRLAGHRAGRVVRVQRADLAQLLRSVPRDPANDMTPEALARRDFG